MPEEEAVSGERVVDDALLSLRERVLRTAIDLLSFMVPTVSLVLIVSQLRRGGLDAQTVVLSAYTLSFPLLRVLRTRLGRVRSQLSLLSLLALTAFFVEVRGGVTVGSVALNVIVLLLSALFFGRRGAALGLGVVVAAFVLAGYIAVNGLGAPLQIEMWDPRGSAFWVRQFVTLVGFGGALCATQVYVVEHLAREAARLRAFAEREQAQRLALERAESEREREREQRVLAQKALEEARRVEVLARLAGGVAHDFNNLLTVIIGTAELMALEPQAANVQEGARDIVETSRRASELTRQLLTLGRRQVSKPQRVVVAELLARLRGALRRVIASDIELGVEPGRAGLSAHVDPAELERALINLAINARDAMPSGGLLRISAGEVQVAADSGEPPGECIEIAVSDTGDGIPPDALERLFEPFFTTKSPGLGSGLGLATVHAFAKSAGGDVRVASSAAGTTFTLRLPRAAETAERAPVTGRERTASDPLRGLSVLVVEDRDEVRATMVRTFAQQGFLTMQAANGDQALELLAHKNDFALLCIDGLMPGTPTGVVIERAERLAPAMRVLLCSGYLPEELLRRGVSAGKYAFLQKPFSGVELLAAAEQVLRVPGAVNA
ncbi:MAG TPA: ATP-binding protein [Polyangiaceae bacterium]|jgi:signal transduction histidine kinase